jgi:8-oxo-dGTP pyrophosphatase MutT (NUDIX family)
MTHGRAAERGVVAIVERRGRILLILRSATVRAPLKWCFPGGRWRPVSHSGRPSCGSYAKS